MILNRQIFEEDTFDSGSLGVLAYLMHPIAEPGNYQIEVRKNEAIVDAFGIEIVEKASANQLDFDLAKTYNQKRTDGANCKCCDDDHSSLSLIPGGYLVFYVSNGHRGYSVRVLKKDAERTRVEFDSTALNKGDIFVLSLMEPIAYQLENLVTGAKGRINVSFEYKDKMKLRPSETPVVNVKAGKVFEPAEIKIMSTQGIVFNILEKSRIVAKKIKTTKPKKDDTQISKKRWVKKG